MAELIYSFMQYLNSRQFYAKSAYAYIAIENMEKMEKKGISSLGV